MNTKKVTITDVAKEASLSIATVSRVINNSDRVDMISRQKVLNAIEKVGYVVVAKRTERNLCALIVPSMENPFFSSVVEGVLKRANEEKQVMVVFSSNGSVEQEEQCLMEAAALKIQALLFCPLSDSSSDLLATLFPPMLPKVIIYRHTYAQGASHIYYNNVQGGYLATKYLLRGGHRNIAFFASFWQAPYPSVQTVLSWISHAKRGSFSSVDRLQGYAKALGEFDIPLDPSLVCTTGYHVADGYGQAKQFISTLRDFDAILCCNDSVACGVLDALRKQNIQVPEQVSVIGYDDSFLSEIARPELTSIHQDPLILGSRAFDQVLSLLGGKKPEEVVLEPSLTIRSSSQMRKEKEKGIPAI